MSAWYRKFISFAPDGRRLSNLSVAIDSFCKAGDLLLKAIVVGAWFYFAIEIGHGLLRHFGVR